MKTFNWKPDTCDCHFELQTEDGNELEVIQVYNSCKAHNKGTDQKRFESAHSDNKYKNKAIAQVCKDHGVEPTTIDWKYDKDMNLELNCEGLTKTKINNSINKVE